MNPLLFAPIFEVLKQVLGGLGLDPEAKARAQLQAFDALTNGTYDQKTEQALALAQISLNTADAQGQSQMQRNWRPFMGWTCGVSLCYVWLAQPMLAWVSAINSWPLPPVLDTTQQLAIVGQMMGLAVARTVEKLKGTA